MKILYTITKSEIGGAQTHVAQLVSALVKEGNTVAVTAFPGGWLEQTVKDSGGVFYSNKFFKNSFNPLNTLFAFRELSKTIKSFDPDIVHAHSSFAGIVTRSVTRGRIPTVFTAHSWAFTEGAPFLRKIIAIIAEKIVSRWAKKIICVSEFDKQLAIRYRTAPLEKLVTIYNGVSIPQDFDRPKKLPTEIVSVGRLAYPKRFDLLIEAINLLPEHVKQSLKIRIVGGGKQRELLTHLVHKKHMEEIVSFTGGVAPSAMNELFFSADVFVLLSNHEGFPMTILEAMATGLPVVASGVGGIPELITESCGVIVPNKKEVIAEALLHMVSDTTDRVAMGEASKERIKAHFTIEKCTTKTIALYREVLLQSKSVS